ncbi:MAG: radical SAM protein [Acidobacteria bacterium]|nr:radical SAM protein [Acidobacteriota bacterium]
MQASIFNKRVPLTGRDELFLMNMFTDSQLVVAPDVADLLDRLDADPAVSHEFSPSEQSAIRDLSEHGFVVDSRDSEWRAVDRFFRDVREDASELRLTVLTTMQCNFACDYCFQGDHGDYNDTAEKMSLATADRLCDWVESRLDELGSNQFGLTFFGGEPLLNLPVMYAMAERLWHATQERGVAMRINVITNGLLLTPDVVDRLEPFGLHSIKITLDGDQEAHDRMRPLRGGQGTFERIIANIQRVAHRCNIAIRAVSTILRQLGSAIDCSDSTVRMSAGD